jgi:hypothetical protein
MRKVRNLGDDRNKGWCVHCGGPRETRDHAPSLVFLDEPYPPDLPASPSCRKCNQGFSLDEEYVACLVECVVAGDVDPERLARPGIAAILRQSQNLTARLMAARREENGQTIFDVEQSRVRAVMLKLARCHAAYELNEPQLGEPVSYLCKPLMMMSEDERADFEDEVSGLDVWPEVGSRAMERMIVLGSDSFGGGWLVVQDGRYRYRTSQSDGLRVRIVIREYLACEIVWD